MPLQLTLDRLPDYHFLFIAPNLGSAWFFEAARGYYERFKPTVVSSGDLIRLVPPDQTVTVSLLTQRDAFRALAVEIAQARADALLDALVYTTPAEAGVALDSRVSANQPFGVPLVPTPTPFLRQPVLPTPGSVLSGAAPPAPGIAAPAQPTPAPGFITMTPSPTPLTPVATENSVQIFPSPGAVTGNGE